MPFVLPMIRLKWVRKLMVHALQGMECVKKNKAYYQENALQGATTFSVPRTIVYNLKK